MPSESLDVLFDKMIEMILTHYDGVHEAWVNNATQTNDLAKLQTRQHACSGSQMCSRYEYTRGPHVSGSLFSVSHYFGSFQLSDCSYV